MVWLCLPDYDYEGYGTPTVHATKEGAERYAAENKGTAYEIAEFVVQGLPFSPEAEVKPDGC